MAKIYKFCLKARKKQSTNLQDLSHKKCRFYKLFQLNLQSTKSLPPPQVKWQNDKAGEDYTDVENEVEEFEKQAVTYVVSA